jgi:integrase
LNAILERARALRWLAANPGREVTIVADPGADPDFNVLTPKQVEDVAAAMAEIADDELPLMRNDEVDTYALVKMRECRALWAEAVRLAAYTGLRFGELRDLRWRDIDWDGRIVHVRRNTPTSAPASVKSKRPKGKRARSLPLIDQAVEVLTRIQAIYPSAPNDLVLPNRANGMLGAGHVRNAFYRGLVGVGLGYLCEKDSPMTLPRLAPHVRHPCRPQAPAQRGPGLPRSRRHRNHDALRAPRPASRCGTAALGGLRRLSPERT